MASRVIEVFKQWKASKIFAENFLKKLEKLAVKYLLFRTPSSNSIPKNPKFSPNTAKTSWWCSKMFRKSKQPMKYTKCSSAFKPADLGWTTHTDTCTGWPVLVLATPPLVDAGVAETGSTLGEARGAAGGGRTPPGFSRLRSRVRSVFCSWNRTRRRGVTRGLSGQGVSPASADYRLRLAFDQVSIGYWRRRPRLSHTSWGGT